MVVTKRRDGKKYLCNQEHRLTLENEGGQGPGSISGARGFPSPPLWLWALCSCFFFPWSQGAVSSCVFGCTQGCSVLCIALFPPLQCELGASCRCWLLGALFVCSRSRVGPCSWAGCPSWSVPFGVSCFLFALLHLFPHKTMKTSSSSSLEIVTVTVLVNLEHVGQRTPPHTQRDELTDLTSH